MKKNYLLALLLFSSLWGTAQNAAGWTALFNGKDLQGWKQLGGKAVYTVENGEIVGTTVPNSPNSFLATEKDFGDFVLEFEFKVDSSMNSGVQFRSESKPDYKNGRVHGYQYEIDPSAKSWSGAIYDEARRDWLYPLGLNPQAVGALKQGQWNQARIECIGPHLRTWINGLPAAYLIDDLTPRGFIALQVHALRKGDKAGTQIRWRHLRIRTTNLQPAPYSSQLVVNLLPNQLSEAEKRNGVSLLWDGNTTQGWHAAGAHTFPAGHWSVKDGVLSALPSGDSTSAGNDLVSEKQYGAFILQFDFKLGEGANSGVQYLVADKQGALGPEYQLLDDARHPDARQATHKLAGLCDLLPPLPQPRARRPVGEWNHGMIIVFPDNRVEHWLNGYKVVEYQRGSDKYQALVARSRFAGNTGFGTAPRGHILLQHHGGAVSFRSIRIQPVK